jgi:dUTP pyrophosphatase
MDKKNLKEYLDKLEEFERVLSDDNEENVSDNFLNEVELTLKSLSDTANLHVNGMYSDSSLEMSKSGDAGMDLTVTTMISNTSSDVTYGFGVAMEIPKGFVGLVFPRSSVRNTDLTLSNSVGVIDSGYRGEIQSTFKKHNGLDSHRYKVGERAAQIIILPYPKIRFEEVEDLTTTDRGEGGFGSTGK